MTNRRFRKLGHARTVWMFFRTTLHSWDDAYFLRDHEYWQECPLRVAAASEGLGRLCLLSDLEPEDTWINDDPQTQTAR